ncbi:hypothetical protein QJS10_CPB18g00092 [Acorus calamus]|uniref:Uncharacterized protein n=1 Tax=Acorus calamus TaxID=4465 RepID=A0AAV9CKJ6_ACOCL|nr:hypothetical protein QJS10_CPB18g00092 [Acorus calamus]
MDQCLSSIEGIINSPRALDIQNVGEAHEIMESIRIQMQNLMREVRPRDLPNEYVPQTDEEQDDDEGDNGEDGGDDEDDGDDGGDERTMVTMKETTRTMEGTMATKGETTRTMEGMMAMMEETMMEGTMATMATMMMTTEVTM